MTIRELEKQLNKLHELMDGSIDSVTNAAKQAQDLIYKYLNDYINKFEVSDGRFVVGQDYTARFAAIQRKINEIIGDVYAPSIKEYLSTFKTVEEINIGLQRDYNQLKIDTELLTPARKTVYNQAAYYLKEGLADAYVQPAKYLLMQAVTTGNTLKDSERILRKWNDGDLSSGSQLVSGRPTPNLNKYATQISRDTLYGYNGSINEIISNEYGLTSFIYTGDIIEDSRPFCRHLVGLKRKIKMEELPALFKKYPDGLKPNTTMKNFLINRGGFSCRHSAYAVKER